MNIGDFVTHASRGSGIVRKFRIDPGRNVQQAIVDIEGIVWWLDVDELTPV